jgi:serine/threonine-protein kinase
MSQTPPPSTQLRLIVQIDLVISGGQKLFPIPDVANMTETDARSTLTSAGLQVATSQAFSTTVPKDSVISQSPAANQKVPGGTTVGITVSLGVQSVSVPGVQSLSRVDAANKLKATNLSSQAVTQYTFSGVTKGLVFAQYPTAGMSVAPGTIVAILVSNGSSISTATPTAAQSATIPSVVGQALKSAQKSLKSAHLGNTIINWSGTGRPTGEVVGQAPEVGTTVPRNINVVLFVSNGK